mgnify:CR=1 FL=1
MDHDCCALLAGNHKAGPPAVHAHDAATQNADSIRKLATDMQKTIEVLQLGADRAERRLQQSNRLVLIATTMAALAFALAAYALAN